MMAATLPMIAPIIIFKPAVRILPRQIHDLHRHLSVFTLDRVLLVRTPARARRSAGVASSYFLTRSSYSWRVSGFSSVSMMKLKRLICS